jgi:hypothetical protein
MSRLTCCVPLLLFAKALLHICLVGSAGDPRLQGISHPCVVIQTRRMRTALIDVSLMILDRFLVMSYDVVVSSDIKATAPSIIDRDLVQTSCGIEIA